MLGMRAYATNYDCYACCEMTPMGEVASVKALVLQYSIIVVTVVVDVTKIFVRAERAWCHQPTWRGHKHLGIARRTAFRASALALHYTQCFEAEVPR